IFEHLEIETPIVFTTAYNQYAIQAFQQNSVDYLLKPITQETLNKAVSKFEKYFLNSAKPEIDYQRLASQIQSGSTSRNRFIVYVGAKIYSIHIDEIAYFFSEQGNTFLKCLNGNTYSINYSLEKLINSLDLALFYRVNRKMIVHIQAIKSAYQYSKSKLKVELNPDSNFDVFVPLDKVVSFKEWLGK
ncbi:MAG: LytTR family DNA-binding domain-containing protein, partial [Bacteroidota bacterium]